jgi:hypothetical protein
MKYKMNISVVEAPIFYIGEGRDAKIHERLCKYEVNGLEGWGSLSDLIKGIKKQEYTMTFTLTKSHDIYDRTAFIV